MNTEEEIVNNQEGSLYIVGSRGYSAYEVAVQNGFVGDEDAWLESLIGPVGPEGPEGEQGVPGPTGATPQLRAGQVETLEPNESAYVNIIGTPEYPILNMGIPKGEKGDPGVIPDLSDYVKNTDYATASKGGVVKSGYYGLQVYNNSGKVYCDVYNYNTYNSIENQRFVSKGTLENVFTGKGFLTQHQDISGKLDVSKVKNEESTTAGDVYDVRYVNSLIGDISSVLDSINGEVIP